MPIPAGLHGFPARRCRDRRMSAPGTNRTLRRRTAHRLRVPDRASADLRPQNYRRQRRAYHRAAVRPRYNRRRSACRAGISVGNLCRTVCRDRRPRRGERLCDRPRYGAPQKGDGFLPPVPHGTASRPALGGRRRAGAGCRFGMRGVAAGGLFFAAGLL